MQKNPEFFFYIFHTQTKSRSIQLCIIDNNEKCFLSIKSSY